MRTSVWYRPRTSKPYPISHMTLVIGTVTFTLIQINFNTSYNPSFLHLVPYVEEVKCYDPRGFTILFSHFIPYLKQFLWFEVFIDCLCGVYFGNIITYVHNKNPLSIFYDKVFIILHVTYISYHQTSLTSFYLIIVVSTTIGHNLTNNFCLQDRCTLRLPEILGDYR